MKLGTLLLRNAEITLTQLEAALRTQVLYGGRLGTNLVELGFLDVDTLTQYLSESLGVPVASQQAFDLVPQETIETFGADRARRFEAFPLMGSSPDVLSVAMVNPRAEQLVTELAEELGVAIEPHVAPELRIYYYLERHYDITRKARYVRVGTREANANSYQDRRRTQPAGGITATPKVVFEPRKSTASEAASAEPDESGMPAPTERAGTLQGSMTYLQVCSTVDRATHRDVIGDVLAAYAHMRFGLAAIFLVRDGNALGWRLCHEDPDFAEYPIEELSLPLGGTSVLQAAHDTAKPYRGGALSAGRPTETQLWYALGVDPPPSDMAVIPIQARFRVVNLVYVHGRDGGALDDRYLAELEKLAVRVGNAYERLLQAANTVTQPS